MLETLQKLRDDLPNFLYRLCQFLEIVVSIIVVVAIIVALRRTLIQVDIMVGDPNQSIADFLEIAFNVVIGIEFVKMLCRHNVGTVVEVLLFALARGMVIGHAEAMDSLITIIAIALLFSVRKFLFIPGLDDKHGGSHFFKGKKEKEHHLAQEAVSPAGASTHQSVTVETLTQVGK